MIRKKLTFIKMFNKAIYFDRLIKIKSIPKEVCEFMKIVECVPNFSEGRREEVIEKIVDNFRNVNNVKLLDYNADKDHNRLVVTVIGEPQAVKSAVFNAIKTAVELIDLNKHEGEHPRLGATDVVPFIPIKDMKMEECVELAKELAKEVAENLNLPVYLYEKAATKPERENLANIRKGEFEGLAEKMKDPEWKPDFGPDTPHPTAGAVVIGARDFLIAFNVNLRTTDLKVAKRIARYVRGSSGGMKFIKAIGVDLKDKGMVQVSMNLTNYKKNPIYRAYQLVKMEAKRWGVEVAECEIEGLVPLEALVLDFKYFLQIHDFKIDKVIEYRMLEDN